MKARLEQPHWLAKATCGDLFIDIIFGMGNGLAMIDGDWYRHSRPAILAATPVRVAPAEELLWHRLFISERHRQDMADIVHLIVCVGRHMDWKRLVAKTAENWPLLLAQIQMFDYVYPEHRDGVPRVGARGAARARARRIWTGSAAASASRAGPLISRFSFTIDVHEWEMHDLREETVESRARASARARDRRERRMGRAEHSGGGVSRMTERSIAGAISNGHERRVSQPRRPGMVRIAAVGDFHCGQDDVGLYRELFARVNDEADVLVLTGDLTRWGALAEYNVVVGELADVTVPIVAVLGQSRLRIRAMWPKAAASCAGAAFISSAATPSSSTRPSASRA